MKKRNQEEHCHQVALVDWLSWKYPALKFYAVPNGEYRPMVVAKRLKAEGVSPGVPDICIPSWFLYIEMKAKDGRVNKKQQEWLEHLEQSGYTTMVCYSCDEAIEKIIKFLSERPDICP